MTTISKTERLRMYLKCGDLRNALKIATTFRLGFTRDERRTLEIARDCMCGNGNLYKSLGIDCEQEIAKSMLILQKMYL